MTWTSSPVRSPVPLPLLQWKIYGTPSNQVLESLWTETFRPKSATPWYNRDLKRVVWCEPRLYKHAKKSNQWNTFKAFQKTCKKEFKKELKKAEINQNNNVIQKGLNENNSKPFWRYVKSRQQDSFGISPLKKMDQLVKMARKRLS